MGSLSHDSNISLIDLSAQFPFDMDDAVKTEICFGETLIISCGHFEGDIAEESTDSECEDSTETESSHEVTEQPPVEIKDFVEEVPEPKDDEEDDDFHIFFFPDCKKPQPPPNSCTSLIIVDGLPKVNPVAKEPKFCLCDTDKQGKCECHLKLPCKCGAKTKLECTCGKDDICICHDTYDMPDRFDNPMPVCVCKNANVCVCYPDGKIRPVCTCDQVDKPCICHPGKYPSPVCTCKHKPKFHFEELQSIGELPEEEMGEMGEMREMGETEEIKTVTEPSVSSGEQPPCECQKPDTPPRCFCLKDKECICKDLCICKVRPPCVCEPTSSNSDIVCKSADTVSICDCTKECTCDEAPNDCKCFVPPKQLCTCGDPANCICFKTCDCEPPCLCEMPKPDPDPCACLGKSKGDAKNIVCTCGRMKESSKKLKKVLAGKHGYRWCHDVDARHTYFDYAYERHDKIDVKEQEKEKFKILGLHEEVKEEEEVHDVHEIKAPPYVKKVRKASIDCCSAVGGISISVETLGEDKDKFLVQVVSHSSKEGAKTGSKLVGILDCNLHTLEENRTEHITKKDKIKEHRSYLAICENGYYNKVTRICGDHHVVKRLYHDFENCRNLLLEAANIILLRYIGLRRYRGNIRTETIMINGLICESIYACLGVSQAIVNGTPLFVVKVERHIIEPSGFVHQTLTVLTLRGYTISHEWADNCYICHLNPLLRVEPEKDEIEQHAPLREKWREDLQLLSDYLKFKSSRSSEGARYVSENGSLTTTLRDYLQAILVLRPHDTLHFTRHYFGSALSALDLPHDDYFDPSSRHVRYFFFEQ